MTRPFRLVDVFGTSQGAVLQAAQTQQRHRQRQGQHSTMTRAVKG